jgi:hypothetical protein
VAVCNGEAYIYSLRLTNGDTKAGREQTKPSSLVTARRLLSLCRSMSLPRGTYDPRRVCLVSFPKIDLGPRKREWGVYLSGALVRTRLPGSATLLSPAF